MTSSDIDLIRKANEFDNLAFRRLRLAAENKHTEQNELTQALLLARKANALRREYTQRTGEPALANRMVVVET